MDRLKSVASRLNPLNYLAGKIFLGFWLTFVLTVFIMTIVAFTVDPDEDDKPVPHHVFNLIKTIEEHINLMHTHGENIDFDRLLRSPRISRSHLFVYYDDSNQMKVSKRLPPDFDLSRLNADSPEPMTIVQRDIVAYGPFTILDKNKAYRLFSLYPYRPHPMSRFRDLPGWLRLGVPLLISVILSFLVAMSVVNPIRRLRDAHRHLAAGNLDTRSNGVALRNDELGDLGREFDHMAVKISQLLAAQKRLLGDVSHELRSPLARLQVALGLAMQPDGKDQPRHLQRIELEANRLDHMIGDVLRLSRLESQLQSIEKCPMSLNSLLEYLIKDANFEAKEGDKEVELVAESDIQVLGDQALLASALENVIRNAIKYTDKNTQVQVTLTRQDSQAQIVVRDFGPGVPTSSLTQLFQPFYRVSDSRQRRSGGTGLGLAIAEKSVRSHGGTITAQNADPKGLEVTIRLPLDNDGQHT